MSGRAARLGGVLLAVAGCAGASPPGRACVAQVTAVYDATPVARLIDGSIWASLDHATFTKVRGPAAHLYASDVVVAGSTAYGTAVVCALFDGPDGAVWCIPLPGPLLDSTNLGAGLDLTVVTDGPVRVVTSDAPPRPPLTGARQLAASMNGNGASFCAVTADGTALCWGSGGNGILGRGNQDSSTFARPVLADALTPLTDVAEIRLGFDSACARKRDGSVWCWGDNSVGQAGFAFHDATDAPFPVPVALPARATRLAASPGRTHCAILADDRVACWGWNADAQAGGDASDAGALPTIVLAASGGPPLAGVTDLAPDRGMRAMCANTASGLRCWGRPRPALGAPDVATPYPITVIALREADAGPPVAATSKLPLSSFGERDGALVYVDGNGLLTFGAGSRPSSVQPPCDYL